MRQAPIELEINLMSKAAWQVRQKAFLIGKTAVGCAVLSGKRDSRNRRKAIFAGCNVEHRYRCHDVHAEVNAISTMIAAGEQDLFAVLVAAERKKFTPCGSCLDWIFQFGGPECWVGYQSSPEGPVTWFQAGELMPHYPE